MTVPRKRFPDCPIERTIAVLSGRWKARILWQLLDSPRRYSELRERLAGVTERALSQALSELRADGVVDKFESVWRVTSLGDSLQSALQDMYRWGSAHSSALPHR